MAKYSDFSPEISYQEETPVTAQPEPPVVNGRRGRDSEPKRRRVKAAEPKRAKAPASERETTPKGESFWKRLKGALTSQSTKMLFGIFLGCLTVYLAVAFCGYFSTCIKDQSQIASTAIGMAGKVANPGGEGGARLSEFLINEGFGVGSLVIVIWLGALTLKLLVGRPKFRTLDFTIKCVVALITLSLIVGLLTYSFHSTINWGGYHGTYVNEFIINFIGAVGATLLSLFMVAVFVVICMRDLVKWIIRVNNVRKEKRRIAEAEKLERQRREDEIRRMQEQEKIDDLKAGEAAEIKTATDISDVPEDKGALQFSEGGENLYEISDTPETCDNSDNSDNTDNTDNSDNSDTPDSGNTDSSNTIEPSEEPPFEATGTGEELPVAAEEESQDSEKNPDKMVVNVNTIGQSELKHYKSEVEMYEAQPYKFPPYDLLRASKERIDVDPVEQIENKNKIEDTLLDYGIPITRIEATVGPTVTLYEIVPDKGVKTAKIRSLADDIALRIAASGVRIIAPIPGKGTVGIEVPNKDRQTVSMRTVIQSKKFQESRYRLPIALGSTISNEVYIADLTKMPHLLVAGATGQGKSVGLNTIIASLLYCKAPYELKFVMVDPKQVEFSFYNKLKDYYMAMVPGDGDEEPVITDMDKVKATLSSLCVEMDQRYNLLKLAQTRNIEEYNSKIKEGKLNPNAGHRFLPYIVVVVDEFGDLMMVAGKEVEMPIARLAQKARAVGMHVIIATQRPSTNVITGIIKANFPARMSFRVFSGIDSKTILDATGANQLIGMGDMLILNGSETVRVQCAFIDTPEVEDICDYVSRQPYPTGPYMLPEPPSEVGDGSIDAGAIGERDSLFEEVARSVVSAGTGSTSMIQRHYSIGYNRAGKIMDQLERAKIVGPSTGGKPRSVLVDIIELEEILDKL